MKLNKKKLQELIKDEVNKNCKDRQRKFDWFEDKVQEGINIREKAKEERELIYQLKLKRVMDDNKKNINKPNKVKLN